MRLERVLVTGGGTGLGAATAQALVEAGARVVVTGRREAPLREVANRLGCGFVVGDVTRGADALLDAAGPVDGLVHSAGHSSWSPVGTWDAVTWDALYAAHVRGPALLTQAFLARCSGTGAVVFVASTLAERPAVGLGPYAAAKAAMVSLARTLALEAAPRVTVNAVLPGVVPTALTRAPRDGADPEAQLAALARLHPLGLGQPADVGRVVVHLLDSPWVTGAAWAVDGGLLAG